MLASCSGEYNASFNNVFNQASKIHGNCIIAWKMIEAYNGENLDGVFELVDSGGVETSLALDSLKLFYNELKKIGKDDDSFLDITSLYEKSQDAATSFLKRDIAKLDVANYELDAYIKDFIERNRNRLK